MAGFQIKRDESGRFSFKMQGCCGNSAHWQAEFDRAFAEQVLRDGGRVESRSDSELVLVDRKGRRHSVGV